jgi:hypothetical protein
VSSFRHYKGSGNVAVEGGELEPRDREVNVRFGIADMEKGLSKPFAEDG